MVMEIQENDELKRNKSFESILYKGVLRNFAYFPETFTALSKKRLRHRCCHMNFAKFLRTPFL